VELRTIVESTAAYEGWLADQIPIVADDLARKHRLMRRDPFTFLRGTYYRFAEQFYALTPELAETPLVPAAGDIHSENFGCWRDREGRLVWGINDLDEADTLPYALDLARLATSLLLAHELGYLRLTRSLIAPAILAGYTRGLTQDAQPLVLAERRRWLNAAIAPTLPQPRVFWRSLEELPAAPRTLPAGARQALGRARPGPGWRYRVCRRIAGVGSLGRPRFVAFGDWQGGLIARELKRIPPPATRWLKQDKRRQQPRARYDDPTAIETDGWLVHRLSPDTAKLDLTRFDRKRADQRLLAAMGTQVARQHVRARRTRQVVLADLMARSDDWLTRLAEELASATETDHQAWLRHKPGRRFRRSG
jgi:Uncharacterized protein conserved in bacteria (DUF2252)